MYVVYKDGTPLDLTHREFELVHYLAKNCGKVMTREHLLQAVWGFEYLGDVRTVDVTIRRLREKLEDDPSRPEYIVTRRGLGYMMRNPERRRLLMKGIRFFQYDPGEADHYLYPADSDCDAADWGLFF